MATCKLKVTQIRTCENELFARFTIHDAGGDLVYATPGATSAPGVPIDGAEPLELKKDGMDYALVVKASIDDDTIEFSYADEDVEFTASADNEQALNNKGGKCELTGDNWNEDGPGECPTMAQVSGPEFYFSFFV